MTQARREQLLEAARDLLAEQGFAATSLRNVAARAGVTTGSVTHHFSDRQDLLLAMLHSAHEAAALRMMQRALRGPTSMASLRGVLEEALPLDATRVKEWRVWLAFWAEAVRDPLLAGENAARYKEWREMLGALVEPLVHGKAARAKAVERLLVLVDGLGMGLLVTGRASPTRAKLAATREQLDDGIAFALGQ